MEAFSELGKIDQMKTNQVKKNYGQIKDLIKQLYINPSDVTNDEEFLRTSQSKSQLSDTYNTNLKDQKQKKQGPKPQKR